MPPEVRYAQSGEYNIAYQVIGDGPRDLVFVPGWATNLDVFWEEPACARFFERLASFSRLILFDKRGTGLSDRVPASQFPTLEQRMDDVRAVMDAVGSERAAVMGVSEGGAMSALFAATYPERTSALVMFGAFARITTTDDYPRGRTPEQIEALLDTIRHQWGGPVGIEARIPSMATDARSRAWWARFLRASASPNAMIALITMNVEIDIRHVLPAIRVPTSRPVRRRHARGRGRDRRIPDRRPARPGAGPGARHRHVHRHRQLDRAGG
jgi:pimeloyl-ACP methyl ester carboxylesterase